MFLLADAQFLVKVLKFSLWLGLGRGYPSPRVNE